MCKYIIILISILSLITTSSCENKWPDNGNLDGMWQLLSIKLDNNVKDVKSTQVYWSIRTNIVQFNTHDSEERMFSHFTKNYNTLYIYDFCTESKHETDTDDDKLIDDTNKDILQPWGITPSLNTESGGGFMEIFEIEQLTSNNMILKSESKILKFRKF